jgi:Mrp family chromosome partitioning ATPase
LSRNLELLERAERDAQLLQRSVFASHGATAAEKDHSPEVVVNPSRRPSAHLTKATEQQLSALIDNLFTSATDNAARAVGFCGVDGEDAPSWIGACAAELAAARLGADICLIDANIAHASVHNHFGLENRYGLLDCLRDGLTTSLYLRRIGPQLVLLSSGSQAAEHETSLNGDALRSCFADLRSSLDYLIVNLGSSEAPNEVFLLSQCLDGLVLVIDANTTSRAAAQETKQAFESAGVKLFGAVLNNREFPVPRAVDSFLQRFI